MSGRRSSWIVLVIVVLLAVIWISLGKDDSGIVDKVELQVVATDPSPVRVLDLSDESRASSREAEAASEASIDEAVIESAAWIEMDLRAITRGRTRWVLTPDADLGEGPIITGRVIGPSGELVRNSRISCTPLDTPLDGMSSINWSRVDTSREGAFAIGNLAPGRYSIQASGGPEFSRSDPLVVQAGDGNVLLVLKSTGSMSGSIQGARANDADRTRLTITGRLDPRVCHFSETDSNGRFRVTGLEPALYDLFASTPEGLVGVRGGVSVRSAEEITGVTIHLTPGSRLTVKNLRDACYCRVIIDSDDVCVAAEFLAGGTTKTFHVPAGALRVRLQQEGVPDFLRELTLSPMDEAEVVFDGKD